MKKFTAFLLILVMAAAIVGCSGKDSEDKKKEDDKDVELTGTPEATPSEEAKAPQANGSAGLDYNTSADGETVSIRNIGTCEDKNIVIPETIDGKKVVEIEKNAFINSKIESITIPEGVTKIGEKAFEYCRNLKTVTLPDSLEELGKAAFYGSGITEITLPEKVNSIVTTTFEGCKDLRVFRAGGELKNIGSYAFSGCNSLETVELNDGLESIRSNVFRNCVSLKKIEIPDTVKIIEDNAFTGCSGLESVKLPKNLREFDYLVFKDCKNLKEVTIDAGAPAFKVVGHCLIQKDNGSVQAIWGDRSFPTDGSVQGIGHFLYNSDLTLTSFSVPDGIQTIEVSAFQGCTELKKVTLPNSLTKIEAYAFSKTGITEITVPDSVELMHSSIFEESAVTKATIGKGVTRELRDTFRNCKSLKECAVLGGKDLKLTATFVGCENLTKLTLGPGIAQINSGVFAGCTNLKEITFTGTKTEWGAIRHEDGWDKDINGVVIHCSDGDFS